MINSTICSYWYLNKLQIYMTDCDRPNQKTLKDIYPWITVHEDSLKSILSSGRRTRFGLCQD